MARREYEGTAITIHWDSSRCIHTGRCLRGLPAVFDRDRRPWVEVEAAGAEEIAATIDRCPSGALGYTLADGTPEPPDRPTTVVPRPRGPLTIRGDVEVRGVDGELIASGPRLTLCRCGGSANPPLCDNTHRTNGFITP